MRFIHVHHANGGLDLYINPEYIESFTVENGAVRINTIGVSDSCFTIKESLPEFVEKLFPNFPRKEGMPDD
jgi:hypothetical protein